nr:uncharacterized protein LOC105338568 [Crassostrea gigas]
MVIGINRTKLYKFNVRTCLSILVTVTIGMSNGDLECRENNTSSVRCCSGFREINGVCKECIGYFGEGCSRSCPSGFYGRSCTTPCNCSVNETCNQFVGCISNLSFTCDQQQNLEQHDLMWQFLITLLCIQGLISVLSISYSLRNRMKWTHNLKITNLGSFNGRVKHSERKCKVNQNKGNHVICNDQLLSSGSSYGQVSSGYNHIRFPKAALVDICTEDYSTTKEYNLRRNKYLTKPCKPTFTDIHDDTEL